MTRMNWAAACLATFIATGSVAAQEGVGTFTGFVFDPLGGGVPDLTLDVTDTKTGSLESFRRVRTNNGGYFEVDNLPAGTYRVGGGSGIRPFSITIHPGERVERTLELELFAVSMTMTVCAECADQMIGFESVRRDMGDADFEARQVVPARLLRPEQLAIRYPNTATEGTVVVKGVVGTDGYPARLTVASDSLPEFDSVVLTALKAVHWEPARVRGSAVEGPIDVTIDFVLRRPE